MFFKHLTPADAPMMAAAVVGACRLDGWALDAQPTLLGSIFSRMLDFHEDFRTLAPATIHQVKIAFPEAEHRSELLDLMIAMEFMCHELSPALSASVDTWARELGVQEYALDVAREVAAGKIAEAGVDFYRLGYIGEFAKTLPNFDQLFERYGIKAYAMTLEEDPELAARFDALEHCAPGTLGRALWDFYTARGFSFPGTLNSVNMGIAQHDWVHVLADYGTTSVGELEVAAFRSTSSDSPGAMFNFIGIIGMFQGGLFASALVRKNDDHVLQFPGAIDRIADAMRRGRECNTELFMGERIFAYADRPLAELRELWSIPRKDVDHSPGWDLREEALAE
jgi:hypothetical protein